MSKYKEIFKLKEMLEKAEIPYIFIDRFEEDRKLMKNNEYLNEYLKDKEYYLLEIMGLLTEEEEKIDSVTGYLTAEDVFNRIVKYFKDKSES